MTHSIDFNVHNLFKIRLNDPAPEAIRALKNQLGVRPSSFDGEPDLTVSYVDGFKTPMVHLVMGSAGFTEDDFYIVSNSGHKKGRVQFPFVVLGQPCKITCESGVAEIPLLNLMINLRMLEKGLVPVHASAFVFNGTGVVVNSWPKGGKTSTLFSFLKHGAQFISDDWLFIDSDSAVYGLMQPIKLSDWQLNQLPTYKPKVSRGKQLAIQTIRWLDTVVQATSDSLPARSFPAKVFYNGLRRLSNSQRHVNLMPEDLFGAGWIAPAANFHVLLLTLSHERPDVVVTPLPTEIAIERLLAALRREWIEWEEYYSQYLYAFPHRRSIPMDTSYRKQREFLEHILADKHIFAVSHPHPVALDKLYQAIAQIFK
jgi:hypothetical protein